MPDQKAEHVNRAQTYLEIANPDIDLTNDMHRLFPSAYLNDETYLRDLERAGLTRDELNTLRLKIEAEYKRLRPAQGLSI